MRCHFKPSVISANKIKYSKVGWSNRLTYSLGIKERINQIINDKMEQQGRINKAIQLSKGANGYVSIIEVQEWLKGKSIFVDQRIIVDRCINLKLEYK